MKKLLLIPFLFALACTPAPEDTPEPSPMPVPQDTTIGERPEHRPPVRKTKPTREPETGSVSEEPGFCHPNTACDTRGRADLARLVDRSNSTFQIVSLKFYKDGDPIAFVLCAKDVERKPVVGTPATVRVKQTGRLVAGDGLTLTGPDGCVVAKGTVRAEDLREGPGSNIVNGYLGGRVLNTVKIIPDSI